jgi:hypothetical protein
MNCLHKTPSKAFSESSGSRSLFPVFSAPILFAEQIPRVSAESSRPYEDVADLSRFAARTQRATLETFANTSVLHSQRPLRRTAPNATMNPIPFRELRRQFACFARGVEINSDRWLGVSMHCPRLRVAIEPFDPSSLSRITSALPVITPFSKCNSKGRSVTHSKHSFVRVTRRRGLATRNVLVVNSCLPARSRLMRTNPTLDECIGDFV